MTKLEEQGVLQIKSNNADHADVEAQPKSGDGREITLQQAKPPTGNQYWKKFYASVAEAASNLKQRSE